MNVQHHKQKNRGFTVIEAIVAIAVLALAITAPLVLAYRSLNATNIARDQVIATFLAQDVMEYILAQRAKNRVNGQDWLEGLEQCVDRASGCRIDTTKPLDGSGMITSNPSQALGYSEANGYGYAGTPSRFSRVVTMQSVEDDEKAVEVTVRWRTGAVMKEFTLTAHIFNSRS